MCAGDDIVLSHLDRRKIDGGGCTWRQMTQKHRADNPEHCAELKYFGPNRGQNTASLYSQCIEMMYVRNGQWQIVSILLVS